MNNENFHPVQNEPPLAHALHKWDEDTRTLYYEYNGRNIISIEIPGGDEVGFRHGSDGNIVNIPFFQNIYVTLESCTRPVNAVVTFTLSGEAKNMRPVRAGHEQAILAQVGNPLMYEVNGLYDIKQDLLIEWYGCKWEWSDKRLSVNENGELTAHLSVELGRLPWTINLKIGYYQKHMGYSYHKPWEFRPNLKPVAGWCSWEACRRNVAMSDIQGVSEFFGETLKDYGLEYIQLDDGYERLPLPFDGKKTLDDGWLVTNERFPNGHKEVVETVRANGMTPAVWTNANVVNPEFAETFKDIFVKDNKGGLLLGEWIDYILDCSDETLKTHVLPIYTRLQELGYEYFKIDAIRHLIMDGLHEAVRQGVMTNEDAEARFRRYMECTREGIGDDAYYLASWGVLSEVVGLVDACRIAMDANPTWAGIRMQLVESARWWHTQRILFTNDPDHICCRTQPEWLKSVISLISLSGSLLMLSDPLEEYTPERVDVIRKNLPVLKTFAAETGPMDLSYPAFTWTKLHGFAVNSNEKPVETESIDLSDAMNMAGIYSTMNDNHPFSSLWAFHIDSPYRIWCVLGRFATVPLSASEISFEDIGLDPSLRYIAFDFWSREYLGEFDKKLPCKGLELGCCQIISLTPVCGYPQLIASSRHVSMDAVSVKSQKWDGERLSLTLEGVPGTTETYWFHVPEGYSSQGLIGAILQKDITFSQKEETLIIEFYHP